MDDQSLGPGKRTITTEEIASAIRAEIWVGKLQPGQPLRQDEIASRFGTSKIPVREALNQLKAEGLVSLLHNRGAVVSGLSPEELEEIYTIRAALEMAALQSALPKLTIADLQRGDEVLAELDAEEDVVRWSDLNWQFHETLYAPARMPRLLEWIKTLHFNIARYLIFYLAELDYQASSQEEHRQILAACRAGNQEAAVACLQEHLGSASRHLISYLKPRTGQERK